jgi:tRNA modification GTPase
MRGGYSSALQQLRNELITIGSLLELELDFSEEDVEFADRTHLRKLLEQITHQVDTLCESFTLGNAIKEGVVVAIVGEPNVGKSTLLNRLAGEQRAMVSDIAGTTRDTIESVVNIAGVRFRFIDTAGLHSTEDKLEQMGIELTHEAIRKAHIILHMSDGTKGDSNTHTSDLKLDANQHLFHIINKIDLCDHPIATADKNTICLSAKSGEGVEQLRDMLASTIDSSAALRGDVVVSSQRHYQALCLAKESLHAAMNALECGISADLLSEDIRQVMHHIGTITGDITTSDLLHSIFSKFCIGK